MSNLTHPNDTPQQPSETLDDMKTGYIKVQLAYAPKGHDTKWRTKMSKTPTLEDRINDILDEILEPNADDETPEGTIRNYRTLVLHDSEFQARQEEAKTAIQSLVDAAVAEARIDELEAIPQKPNGLPEYIQDRLAALRTTANGQA